MMMDIKKSCELFSTKTSVGGVHSYATHNVNDLYMKSNLFIIFIWVSLLLLISSSFCSFLLGLYVCLHRIINLKVIALRKNNGSVRKRGFTITIFLLKV